MVKKTSAMKKQPDPAPTERTQPRAVYLSAPPGLDTRPIRRALEDKGLRSFSPDQLDMTGSSLPDVVREGIGLADFVLGVVDPTPASNFVLFEVGYARGVGKPTFVLLADDAPAAMWVSSGVPYFKFNPNNPSGLDFAVTQILAIPQHGTRTSTAAKQTRPLGDRAGELLDRVRAKGDDLTPTDLEEIVGLALQQSAATSVSSGVRNPQYLDFSVWSDDFSPWIGNPVGIECRTTIRNGTEVNSVVGQMALAMTRSSIPFGLLVYARADVDVPGALSSPTIAATSAVDFLESLRTTSLGDLVRRLRNQRVHEDS